MEATTFIYVLNDPRDGGIRYVGKSNTPYQRWKNHCQVSEKKSYKNNWISELRELGLTPELEILEEVPCDNWEEAEREYIRVFRMIGIRLTNDLSCPGGEGVGAGIPHGPMSEITKEKIRQQHIGKTVSLETRKRIGLASKGRQFSRESISQGVAKRTGQTRSLKTKMKMSASLIGNKRALGFKHSEETCKKFSAAQTGNLKWLGKKHSLETREKMRVSALLRETKKCLQ